MPENNLTVENNNSNNEEVRFLTEEDILKIPGIYFDTVGSLIEKLGVGEIAKKGANFIAKVGFGVGTAIDLTINLSKDENSDEFYVALSTIGKDTIKFAIGRFAIKPLVAAITAGAASLLGLSTAPVWLTVVTTVGVVVATTYATDKVLNLVENELKENIGEFELFSPTIYGKMTRDEFMLQELEQNNQTTKDFCVRMYPKFARYVQTYDLNKIDINGSSPMAYINKISYDKVEQNLTIQTQNEVDSVSEAKEISQIIAETTKVQTLTINSQTYNIKELSNLELRNAIENIPQVSFLLSHILIKVGEYLDL
ncbi:MAG: hypothetical protein PUK41_07345, partial [Campylobacter hominis]|uniref:hypothetical protein n=1 Tax=Campylobacter hominis TaxID=76517 RepID=UPI0023F16493